MNLEHMDFTCEVKAIGDPDLENPGGTFAMYAATFGNIDRGGDVIEQGAFKNIPEFLSDGWIALNHRSGELPIGYPIDAMQDSKGLFIRGGFHSTPEAQAARAVVKERFAAGKSVKASIGYVVDDASYEMRGGQQIRSLKSIDIFEASFVNLPMNPMADVVGAKSIDDDSGWLDRFKAWVGLESKKGRVVSATNHAKLAAAHGQICEGTAAIGDFLDAYDPSEGVADDGKSADALMKLRRRALEGRRMDCRPRP